MAESLRSRAKTSHRRPSASLPQRDHTPLRLLSNSPIVQVARNHIPIKQYSNKFLREMSPKPILAVPETLILNNRRRFNTILPKKLMFCRMTPRQRLRSKN